MCAIIPYGEYMIFWFEKEPRFLGKEIVLGDLVWQDVVMG